jgi:hypothetical protein
MISKEAELFEKANIVDIGLQPNEFGPRRGSAGEHSSQAEMLHHHFDNSMSGIPETSPPVEDELLNLSIDEVDKIDNNMVVDEAFQRSLDERASQFMLNETNSINTNSFPTLPKPNVEYTYTDVFPLIEELDQWFTSSEVVKLQTFQKVYDARFNLNFYDLRVAEKEDIINDLICDGASTKDQLNNIECLVSIMTGHYGQDFDMALTVDHITKNAKFFVGLNLIPWVVGTLARNFQIASTETADLLIPSHILFHSTTILYIITLVGLESKDESLNNKIKAQFDSSNILETLVRFIDQWRWNNRNSMRIRNIIMLFTKVFKFQIGDLDKRNKAKVYLEEKFNIVRSNEDPNKLTASPIDFHTYRQELITRYPSFIPPPSTLPENFEDSTSLTQFISIPKNQPPRHTNSTNNQPPTIHIATPCPSPLISPVDFSTKSQKGKRMVQSNNFVYPFIYPTENDFESVVPKSIQEATDLFASRVRDKLHLVQLWDEFDHFIKQERGWVDSLNSNDGKFIYQDDGKSSLSNEIQSLQRIERFYESCLPYFSSLVHVLLEIVISAQSDSSIWKTEKLFASDQMLNILSVKNTVLKDASYILVLMLKWFKISHVLKYEHLSCLIYDSNYYSILIQYLKSFDDEILERIQNTSLRKSSINGSLDDYFCFSLHNLLTIASKITTQKTQRVLDLCDKDASAVLRQIFAFNNKQLWRPALKLIKEIAPLKRKQWKAKNMDIISLVYLHGETTLKDNWLSGRDIGAEVNDRYGQEIALRALIQFYNVRKYSESMGHLGYKRNEGNFFTREAEFLANEI